MAIKAKTRRFTHGFDKYESRGLVDQENFAHDLNEIMDPLEYQNWVNKRFHGDKRPRAYDPELGCWTIEAHIKLNQSQNQKFRRKTNQRQRLAQAQAHLGLQDLARVRPEWIQ